MIVVLFEGLCAEEPPALREAHVALLKAHLRSLEPWFERSSYLFIHLFSTEKIGNSTKNRNIDRNSFYHVYSLHMQQLQYLYRKLIDLEPIFTCLDEKRN